MPNIQETIENVKQYDPELARQIQKYVKDHSYGLVFEHNLPEAVRLWKKTPCKGDVVNILPPRGQFDTAGNKIPWVVSEVRNGELSLVHDDKQQTVPIEDVVVTVSYRDVIYPGLKVIDKVERGNPEDPYHVIINAENYHALEALAYAYAGKVDCIYIDPPYNVGKKDWKYNNDYVDADDQYKHSKWLAFMERRLKLAKQLLNPNDSVLIVTIDEKEYLRLGMLLEQMFPEAKIQMISSVINQKGSARSGMFHRTDEYVYIVFFGKSLPALLPLSENWKYGNEKSGLAMRGKLRWQSLRRDGISDNSLRINHPDGFYPIYVSMDGTHVVKVGDTLGRYDSVDTIENVDGCITVLPIRTDGKEGRWQLARETMIDAWKKGYVRVSYKSGKVTFSYLKKGEQAKIESGDIPIVGYREDGSVIVDDGDYEAKFVPGTQWNIKSHDAGIYGTNVNTCLMPDRSFPYPKSLYAVEDVLRFFVANKPNALIVDFFAGSGTTTHATMLLNHLDGGHRRTVSITNNEVSAEEEKKFTEAGLRPYDPDWEKYGIANYCTWPRIKAAITGVNTKGEQVKGDYKFTEEFPMSEGFQENAVFCELTYESAWPIRLDNAFDAIAPILWMLAGCKGPIIRRIGKSFLVTDYYGVLFDYNQASKFCDQVKKKGLETAFVVTDDQRRFSNMCKRLPGVSVHRLYETYLRTFEICGEGGLD